MYLLFNDYEYFPLQDSAPKVLETVEAIDSDAGPFGQVIYQLGV